MRFFRVSICSLVIASSSVVASADTIDFESDSSNTALTKYSTFTSVESAGVTFSSSNLGAGIVIADFGGGQSIGQGLGNFDAFGDGTSRLIMNFTGVANSLSFVFGNDDYSAIYSANPYLSLPIFDNGMGGLGTYQQVYGDLFYAELDLFNGNTYLDTVAVPMNLNDLADQTISYSGGQFTRAVFHYTDANLQDINLIEVVDNVTFSSRSVATPGPEAAIVFALVAGMRRRRRRA